MTNRVAGHVIMKQLLHSHLNDVPAAVKNYCRSPAAPYYVWNANYAEEVKGATGASEIVTQFWKQIKTELDRMQRLTSQQTLSLYPLSLRDFAIQLFEIDSPTDEHLKRALLFHAGLNRDLPFYSALNNLVAAEPRDSALAAQFYSRLEQEFHRSHRVSEELQKWSQSDQANTLQYSTDS